MWLVGHMMDGGQMCGGLIRLCPLDDLVCMCVCVWVYLSVGTS